MKKLLIAVTAATLLMIAIFTAAEKDYPLMGLASWLVCSGFGMGLFVLLCSLNVPRRRDDEEIEFHDDGWQDHQTKLRKL